MSLSVETRDTVLRWCAARDLTPDAFLKAVEQAQEPVPNLGVFLSEYLIFVKKLEWVQGFVQRWCVRQGWDSSEVLGTLYLRAGFRAALASWTLDAEGEPCFEGSRGGPIQLMKKALLRLTLDQGAHPSEVLDDDDISVDASMPKDQGISKIFADCFAADPIGGWCFYNQDIARLSDPDELAAQTGLQPDTTSTYARRFRIRLAIALKEAAP